MQLISYSQNHEDIVLWRALRNVQNGFYVDVGANDPTEDSVTRLFYDRGWHGINIEPSDEYHDRLAHERSRDINLKCAVGDCNGTITFYETATRGWSTSDPGVGLQYVAQGEARTHEVEQLTLDTLLGRHAPDTEIHFLKIDVEGAEAQVLRGLSLGKFRPWVLVVEALDPISQEPRFAEWEGGILGQGYSFVYFDGLNRFYLAAERQAIVDAFNHPPGVLDHFMSNTEVQLLRAIDELNTKIAHGPAEQASQHRIRQLEAAQADLLDRLSAAQEQAAIAQGDLAAVLASRSWRVTRPLRDLADLMRGRPREVAARLRPGLVRRIRGLARRAQAVANRHPKARAAVVTAVTRTGLIHPFRRLQTRLLREPSAQTSALDQAWNSPSPASLAYLEQLQSRVGRGNSPAR
ncbi:FkbM family methyltransferase [Ramlibacter henchirensis]|uniref:FkbM family methyltransferase n=1 Tax=Ramlibacter henchirensis TaxID=204072 RepID=A0A4Z0C2T8_9BURK|nr:FkbM family methyltransferase [Ramlibacter henchirensis]TFZ05164.1 FkbM family methyltransferase [Ramlibacter henchirensis]